MLYDAHIFVCTNRREPGAKRGSCAEKGSEELRDYLKKRVKELGIARVRVNAAGCLDRCELGPCVVAYPEGAWYKISTREEADALLATQADSGKWIAGRCPPELKLPG